MNESHTYAIHICIRLFMSFIVVSMSTVSIIHFIFKNYQTLYKFVMFNSKIWTLAENKPVD